MASSMQSPDVQIRALKMIAQHVILASSIQDGDIIDPSTGKTAIPEPLLDSLLHQGLARWSWSQDRAEHVLVLTPEGQHILSKER